MQVLNPSYTRLVGELGKELHNLNKYLENVKGRKKHLPVKEIGQEQMVRVTIIEKKPTFRN